MNVFIYEGTNRLSATKSIVDANKQAQIGKEYRVNFNSGIVIVAFPNKNQQTEFEFDYYVEEFKEKAIEVPEPRMSQVKLSLLLFGGVTLLCLLAVGSPWYYQVHFLPNLKVKIN